MRSRYGRAAALALMAAAVSAAQPRDACFAYLLHADISVLCGGVTTPITHRRDIANFAVGPQGDRLAYVTDRPTRAATVVDLKTGASHRVDNVDLVVPSCGTILGERNSLPDPALRDVVAGEPLHITPYVRVRCSADRKVVAGLTAQDDALRSGLPPTKLASPKDADWAYFQVSPGGHAIAWFHDVRPLCVALDGHPPTCLEHETVSDPASVNDDGEVLAALGTGRGCVYRTSYDFSPAPSPSGGDDECLGVGYWKPGITAVVFLAPLGRNPQWIAPQTARLLRDWAARAKK